MNITISRRRSNYKTIGWTAKSMAEAWNILLQLAEGYNPIVTMAGIKKRKRIWIKLFMLRKGYRYGYY